MNYCSNCGNKIDSNADVCVKCGVLLNKPKENTVDKGGIGYGILGFFIPIVGLIIYICWKSERPKSAKNAGLGALISTILSFLIVIFIFVFGIVYSNNINSSINDNFNYWYDYDDDLRFD